MRMYFLTTDTGCFEFLFTTDEQRAIQLFSIFVVLAKVRPTKMWFTELTLDTVIPAHRDHLREALSQGVEAFGSYQDGKGWMMRLVQDKFDELSEASEGGVQ